MHGTVNMPKKMQQKGANVIVDIAAWPPTQVCGNPLKAWEKCSSVTGLPVLVCNQTGKLNGWI